MITEKKLAQELNAHFKKELNLELSKDIVKVLFENIHKHVYESKKVRIHGLITIYIDPVPERDFFNPATLQKEVLPARWKIITNISRKLYEKIKSKPCYLPSNRKSEE